MTLLPVRQMRPHPKLGRPNPSADPAEIARTRAETEAAIAEARKSHERLREAIDILPQGIVFLDADGRYILWNKKYSEIYNRSSDLFSVSTPSAVIVTPSPMPRLMIERTIACASRLEPRSRTNDWSILILSKGKLRR
jgi:PAS domain-containing protein